MSDHLIEVKTFFNWFWFCSLQGKKRRKEGSVVSTLNACDRSKKITLLAPKPDTPFLEIQEQTELARIYNLPRLESYLNRFKGIWIPCFWNYICLRSIHFIVYYYHWQRLYYNRVELLKIFKSIEDTAYNIRWISGSVKPDSTSLHRSLNRKSFDSASRFGHLSAS